MSELFSVSVVVFYDQNGNGTIEADEVTRLSNVLVESGVANARSARLTGRATLALTAGTHTLGVNTASLPPYFRAGAPVTITVPVTGDVPVPVTLPIGSNRPAVFVALGDSITVGDGSADGRGYPGPLEERLRVDWGQGEVINEGVEGNKSNQGAERIGDVLSRHRPAYVLIVLGTNDWNKCDDVDSCFTQESMRSMLRQAKGVNTLPFMATILPANTGFDFRAPASRNEWVEAMNERLRAIAKDEGAVVVDLYAAFTRAAAGDLSKLFADHVHPNDAGYRIMTDEFFRAVTEAPAATTSASLALPARLPGPSPPGGLRLIEVVPIRIDPLGAEPSRPHARPDGE